MASGSQIRDADVLQFADLAAWLESEYVDHEGDPWASSPFGWIQALPSRKKGAIGEKLVAAWAEKNGFDVARTGDSDADRIINGRRIEIKYSKLWADNGIYKFQQIRDQDYDFCFCLGLSPFDVHAWFIPKSELMQNRPPALVPQHGGSRGQDTRWLSFPATDPPAWLQSYGGTLATVRELIESAGRGRHGSL